MKLALHKLKLPIRRNKGDASVGIELAQPNALVELAVVELHCITRPTFTLALIQHELVVQSKLALGCSRKVCSHEYVSINICTKN